MSRRPTVTSVAVYGVNSAAAAKDAVPAAEEVAHLRPLPSQDSRGAAVVVVAGRRVTTVPTFDGAVVQPCAQTRTALRRKLDVVAREHAEGRYLESRFLRHFTPLEGFDPATAASDTVACRQCTLSVSLHRDGDGDGTPGGQRQSDGEAPTHPPAVRLAAAAASGYRDHVGCHHEYPAHWRGSGAWFARFLEFDGYGPVSTKEQEDGEGGTYTRYFQTTRYKCTAPRADDDTAPCGETFTTRGFEIRSGSLSQGAAADLTPLTGDTTAVADHFRSDRHNLRPHPTIVGWTTTLCDCCSHPESVCDCLLCYTMPPPMCGSAGDGNGMFCALQRAAPSVPPDGGGCDAARTSAPVLVHGAHRKAAECNCASFASCLVCPILAPAAIPLYTGAVVLTALTCAGIPCEGAPLMCWPCFHRRRRFVYALGEIDESAMETSVIVLCCCPCSELQQWRELRNSGVWPGLACGYAGPEDTAAMAPAAVRRRYGFWGEGYGVTVAPRLNGTAAAAAAPDAANVRRVQQEWHMRPGPAVVYGRRVW